MHQHATLEDTVYLGFAANLTSGTAGDGATPLYDVRLAGAAASAAPVLSGTPTLLTHANYSDGCYEVAVAATAANGFAANNTYLVFVTLTIDSVTPAACIGSFRLAPVPANAVQWLGTACAIPTVAGVPEVDLTHIGGGAQSATDLKDFADDGYDPATNKVQGVVLVDTITTYTGDTPQTGDSFARIGVTGSGLTSLATQASVNTVDDLLDTEIAAIKAKTDNLPTDPADASDIAASFATIAGYIDTEIAAIKVKTDLIPAAPAAVGDIPSAATIATAVLTTQVTESYRADGAAPTLAQAQCEIIAHLGESSIVSTTKTIKKVDGATTAATFTLNSATEPTSITRAT